MIAHMPNSINFVPSSDFALAADGQQRFWLDKKVTRLIPWKRSLWRWTCTRVIMFFGQVPAFAQAISWSSDCHQMETSTPKENLLCARF